MVHTIKKKAFDLKAIEASLKKETDLDREAIEKYYHKLPYTGQVLLRSALLGSSFLGVPEGEPMTGAFPFRPKAWIKKSFQKRRYGVFSIHDNKIYVGYVKPLKKKSEVEVELKEVFP